MPKSQLYSYIRWSSERQTKGGSLERQKEYAAKIAEEGKQKALYLVYGFNRILPRYQGLEILIPDVASQGIVSLYGKAES